MSSPSLTGGGGRQEVAQRYKTPAVCLFTNRRHQIIHTRPGDEPGTHTHLCLALEMLCVRSQYSHMLLIFFFDKLKSGSSDSLRYLRINVGSE